jgi:hypothetical protein
MRGVEPPGRTLRRGDVPGTHRRMMGSLRAYPGPYLLPVAVAGIARTGHHEYDGHQQHEPENVRAGLDKCAAPSQEDNEEEE